VNRVATSVEEDAPDPARLLSLASVQARLVLHALSFPRARRVVYSTCSVHRTENESVVARVLRARGDDWRLVAALPEFPSRGVIVAEEEEEREFLEAEKCVRLGPTESLTNGFFVACFERRDNGDGGKSDGDGLVSQGDVVTGNDEEKGHGDQRTLVKNFKPLDAMKLGVVKSYGQPEKICKAHAEASNVDKVSVKAKKRKRNAAVAGVDEAACASPVLSEKSIAASSASHVNTNLIPTKVSPLNVESFETSKTFADNSHETDSGVKACPETRKPKRKKGKKRRHGTRPITELRATKKIRKGNGV